MKFNVRDTWEIVGRYYSKFLEYEMEYDPDVTYQEFVLYMNIWDKAKHGGEVVDSDDFEKYEWEWEHYMVAHFFQPRTIDKPWDQVITNRTVKKMTYLGDPDNPRLMFEEGRQFLDLWKKVDEAEHLKYEKEEERRKKANQKQRERRALQKILKKAKAAGK